MRILSSRKSVSWDQYFSVLLFVGAWCFLFTSPCYASSVGNLPFNGPMDIFKSNFIEFCFSAAVVLVMVTCVSLALGEWGDGIKRFITIIFFLSLALSASTGVSLLFGTGTTF
ncbi:MAG: TrbC/VirB2 family protein [Gammaproteobacteria bacterium]|nr:TrbC/VirB2 family protein [Gammaproteobacteria bacterium]